MIEINHNNKELNKTQVMLIENIVFDCFECFIGDLLEPASKSFISIFLSHMLAQKNQSDFKLLKSKFCNEYKDLNKYSENNFWGNVSKMIDFVNGADSKLAEYASSSKLHSEKDVEVAKKNAVDYIKIYSKNLVNSRIHQYNHLSMIEKEQKVILAREKICDRDEKLLDRQQKMIEEKRGLLVPKIDKHTQTEFEDKKPANLVDKCLQVNLNKSLKNQRCKSN